VRPEDRETYAHDLWPRWLLSVHGGQRPSAEPPPAAVVWPESAAEVQAVLKLCREREVPLVPYGAGSGVAGGAVGPAGSLVLDTKRMRGVEVDATRGVVTFEPGILGWHLEEKLNDKGLTLGHFPSSIMCSTAGGWLATRGAGQMSTKYGKIEDMVQSLELVTGAGERLRVHNGDRGGADWVQLVTGSEGTLGVITRATCAVRRMPQSRRMRGYSFPTVEAACYAVQHLLQLGLRPSVVRLYDELDTLISGLSRSSSHKHDGGGKKAGGVVINELLELLQADARRLRGRVERWLVQTLLAEPRALARLVDRLLDRLAADCLLVLGFEGDPSITLAEEACARDQMARCGGRDLGEEPGERWLRHRYNVSFKMPRVFRAGAFTDTIEVASTWDRLPALYHKVRAALAPHALCMAHFSHAYVDGCSIYFTVLGRRTAEPSQSAEENRIAIAEDERRYDALWRTAMEAALAAGATISHHHGVGRLKAPFMAGEHAGSLAILSALRSACDPQNICNSGNLAPLTLPANVRKAAAPEIAPAGSLEVQSTNFLAEADCGMRLFELEQALLLKRLSLGGLSPTAWGRTLGEALAEPRPSEASLESSRLRDRRVRIRAVLADGTALWVPPLAVPRRATGPDLGQALLGQPAGGAIAKLTRATLRLSARAAAPQWTGYLFDRLESATQALLTARALHGAAGLAELLLASRPLLVRVLGEAAVTERGEWALLARPAGPEAVASAVLGELDMTLGKEACGRLSSTLCRAFWAPEALCGASATADSVAAFASRFPSHEQALDLVDCTPERVAARLLTSGACLLCGVYLHGMTLCADRPLAVVDAQPAADDAQAVLWPRLAAALAGSRPDAP